MALLWHLFLKYYQITHAYICISFNTNYITPILHTFLTLCWSCLPSTANHSVVPLWFWFMRVNKQKTTALSWLHRMLSFLEISGFWPLLWQSWLYEKCYSTHKLYVYSKYEIIFLCVVEKVFKLDGVSPVDNRPSTDWLHHLVFFLLNFFSLRKK